MDWQGRFAVREKAPSDLVTDADLASQDAIRSILLGAFPMHGFLSEENLAIPSQDDGLRWIVDPLDGTMNYVHGLRGFAVSIALEQFGELLVGAVYDPLSNELFTAARGGGAYLNGSRLQCSGATDLSQALVAHSFPAGIRDGDPEIDRFVAVLTRAQATRRSGSAALNLCAVAAGWMDAYWSLSCKAWDIAAGALIVREAGGVFGAYTGGPGTMDDPRFVAAATPELERELREVLHVAQPRG